MLYDYFKQRKIGLFSRFVLGVNIYRNISPDIEPVRAKHKNTAAKIIFFIG